MESKQTLLFRLYQILCEYSDEEHPLTQQHIIELLERDFGLVVERKAVGRNMSYLKEMGYNIRSDKSGSYIEDRPFENSELRILIDSVLGSSTSAPFIRSNLSINSLRREGTISGGR